MANGYQVNNEGFDDEVKPLASKAGCDLILMPKDEAQTMKWVLDEMKNISS